MMYRVKTGGLMRCCLATLDETMSASEVPPKEGDVIQCRFHASEGMIFRDGYWEWNAPPFVVDL